MASTIDQQFIEYIVKSIVNKPEAVSIERRIDEKGVLLELTVDQEDLGRVIGKRGATAQSLRTLLRALGTKNDARYNLKIVDVGPPPARRDDTPARSDDAPDASNPAVKPADDDSTAADDQTVSDDIEEPFKDENTASENTENSESTEETDHSDLASRTRAELADLDDLDV
jgi:hypothetical protein